MAVLKVEERKESGKYTAFNLRRDGFLPGVIYGKEMENILIKIPFKDFEYLLHTGERIVDLEVGKKKHKVIIKEVQHGTFAHEILHADFRTISETDTITVSVAIALKGEAAGIEQGGVVEQSRFDVDIECLPKDLPEKIECDLSALGVGDVFYVSNLPGLPGVTYKTDPGESVVSCHMPAGEEEPEAGEEAEGEEGAEPEVIGEKEREGKKEEAD